MMNDLNKDVNKIKINTIKSKKSTLANSSNSKDSPVNKKNPHKSSFASTEKVKVEEQKNPTTQSDGGLDRWQPSEEAWDGWGFADSGFEWNSDREIRLRGQRYPLCKHRLGRIIPWFEEITGIRLEKSQPLPRQKPPMVPASILSTNDYGELVSLLSRDQVSLRAQDRLRHGHGQFHREIYDLRYGRGLNRVPDGVVWPQSESQVAKLVSLARVRGWMLVPFGGGTNVTEALRCPREDRRPILAVDMRQMNRILWLDPVNNLACIEAGAVGRHMRDALADQGFTMGHEPDSLEFSTLGGWIATNASGMKKNLYGNIEDLVLDLTLVTGRGPVKRLNPVPRESSGIDLRRLAFGSEGTLGIITSAVVKLAPLPEITRYGSYVFSSMESGVAFAHELVRLRLVPASVRLVDPVQFQFAQALKGNASPIRKVKSTFEKLYVTALRGFDPSKMVACTLVYEGARDRVLAEEQGVRQVALRHGGISAGPENGARGYQLTFSIAYLRDFIMDHHFIADSFETSVPWSQVLNLCKAVNQVIRDKHRALGLPGRPFFTYRITQLYTSGVCVYFYLAIPVLGFDKPLEAYRLVEEAARMEILKKGGSLSHHHGIGKHREKLLGKVLSKSQVEIIDAIKKAFDPQNIFGIANQGLGSAGDSCSGPAFSVEGGGKGSRA